ncbi:MAG: DNA integrity scanning diadenylate cyclase DisA [Candidatus Nanopelagicales bacterium]
MREVLAMVAPGTPLRDGLERILRGRTGGLIVLGHERSLDQLARGGFAIDVDFTATRLRELAKMDGAIVLDRDASRILRANVALFPDSSLPTDETGTRHSTADRVSKETGIPVVSVSKSMNTVAIYVSGRRHVLEESSAILARANQAVATLERYKMRLDGVSGALSALEIEDLVTVRDVAVVVQRLEMVLRIAREIEGYVVELGTDGRLLTLQLEELVAGVAQDRVLIVRDYVPSGARRERRTDKALGELGSLTSQDLLDLGAIARIMGYPPAEEILDLSTTPRGYRLLARIPRLPESITDRIVTKFGTLPKLLSATTEDLQRVEGVGESRARSVRDGVSRLAETTILDRYA